jgi:outer membrane lipoprotein carrier protein
MSRTFMSQTMLKGCLRVVLACLCAGSLRAEALDVHSVAANVDKHYNGLASLQTGFSESYRGGGLARDESGTMWLKKPGKMRWEYDSPVKKLFVVDGKTAWFYVPGERQARRAKVKQLDDFRSPLRYLLGHTKLEKEFSSLSLATGEHLDQPSDVALSGVPKGMEDRASKVIIEVTPDSRISRISIYSLDGSVTDFRFAGERDNVPIGEGRFHFDPPPGVEVLGATELGP